MKYQDLYRKMCMEAHPLGVEWCGGEVNLKMFLLRIIFCVKIYKKQCFQPQPYGGLVEVTYQNIYFARNLMKCPDLHRRGMYGTLTPLGTVVKEVNF